MDHREKILNAFNRYCEKSGLAPATVSTQVMDDGKFYDRIKDGGGFTMKTYEKVITWFKEHKPRKKAKPNGKTHD